MGFVYQITQNQNQQNHVIFFLLKTLCLFYLRAPTSCLVRAIPLSIKKKSSDDNGINQKQQQLNSPTMKHREYWSWKITAIFNIQ